MNKVSNLFADLRGVLKVLMKLYVKAPRDLWVEIAKAQWLTSGEWECPLDNDPKLAMVQPNKS